MIRKLDMDSLARQEIMVKSIFLVGVVYRDNQIISANEKRLFFIKE